MLSIMLVEDSVAVRDRLRHLLKDIEPFRILGEFDAAGDAIAAIDAQAPDVVLLDIRLRTGNGIEVLHHLKRHAPSAKVIVFSQYDEPEYREQFQRAGADFFFDKARETGRLVAALKQLAG